MSYSQGKASSTRKGGSNKNLGRGRLPPGFRGSLSSGSLPGTPESPQGAIGVAATLIFAEVRVKLAKAEGLITQGQTYEANTVLTEAEKHLRQASRDDPEYRALEEKLIELQTKLGFF